MLSGTPEWLAAEARRLKNETVLNLALAEMKRDAMERLTSADPDDKTAIMAAQADYRAANELPTVLERFIIAGTPMSEEDESTGPTSVA